MVYQYLLSNCYSIGQIIHTIFYSVSRTTCLKFLIVVVRMKIIMDLI